MADDIKSARESLFGATPPITPASHPEDPENVAAQKAAAPQPEKKKDAAAPKP